MIEADRARAHSADVRTQDGPAPDATVDRAGGGATRATHQTADAPDVSADLNHLFDVAKAYLGNTLSQASQNARADMASDQNANANTAGPEMKIDLGQLIELAKLGFGASFGSAMAAHQQNVMIMRKHILRSEAELLTGLLAVVENEEKRVETEMSKPADQTNRKSGPTKVVID